MKFWTTDNVIQVHVELSTFCNAACPKCPRYIDGTMVLRPGLELEQITLEKFKRYFDEKFIKQTTQWLFCGTHGDPMMAKDSIDIFEYLYSINDNLQIRMNTNGGMRSQKDWKRLGELSKKYNKLFTVTFSIDGLEDTNHLYRRNVDWNILIRNVKTYIDAGGRATWDFLVFRHNQHQIDEAKRLAADWGFSEFAPKRALGFECDGNIRDVPVWDEDGNYTHTLEASTNPEFTNHTLDQIKSVVKMPTESLVTFYKNSRDILKEKHTNEMKQWNGVTWNDSVYDFSKYNEKEIKCKSNIVSMHKGKVIYGSEIFLTAAGIVGPCCYIGTQFDVTYRTVEIHQLQKKIHDYGVDNFDLNKKSLYDILEEGHLNKLYASSWDKKNDERILYCSHTCGENSHIDRIWNEEARAKFD